MKNESFNTFTISIAGASGSGKTRTLKMLKNYFNENICSHLDLDGYHKHSRYERTLKNIFPEDIEENNIEDIVNDIIALKQGLSIQMPVYNHISGKLEGVSTLQPKKILFIEGLHAILLNDFLKEKLIDLNVFLNTDNNIRRAWKVNRDIKKRGYTYERVISEIEEREYFENKYINCQINNADVLINTNINSNEYKREIFISTEFLNHRNKVSFNKYFSISNLLIFKNKFHQITFKGDVHDKSNQLKPILRKNSVELFKPFELSTRILVNLIIYLFNNYDYEI